MSTSTSGAAGPLPAPRLSADICVLGAGPAGAAVARRLALLGHDVLVVERAAFPRRQIGESLPPGILPLLDALGLRQRIEDAGFLRPERAIVLWADDASRDKVQEGAAGFQVERGRFDQILLSAAREAGARVLQPATAARPTRADDGGWRVPVRHGSDAVTIAARILIDASGRRYVSGGRRGAAGATTLALYAYWRGAPLAGPETRVEAGQSEWYWCAPLAGGTAAAAVFVDPKRLAEEGAGDAEALYRKLLGRSRLLAPCLEGRLAGAVTACDATSRYANEPLGRDFIRVGDAVLGLDPLSSQGVQTAIASALQAAVVVNTFLTRPENADQAMAFYRERQAEKVARHTATAAEFYRERAARCDTPFWRRRAAPAVAEPRAAAREPRPLPPNGDSPLHLSAEAVLVPTPIIEDDIVTTRRGLRHPALERPLAFLGEVPIDLLMSAVAGQTTSGALIEAWSRHTTAAQARQILAWMWARRILVAPDHGEKRGLG